MPAGDPGQRAHVAASGIEAARFTSRLTTGEVFVSGMILAPVVLNYIRLEASRIEVRRDGEVSAGLVRNGEGSGTDEPLNRLTRATPGQPLPALPEPPGRTTLSGP